MGRALFSNWNSCGVWDRMRPGRSVAAAAAMSNYWRPCSSRARSGQCRSRRLTGRRSRDDPSRGAAAPEPIDVGGEPAVVGALPRLEWTTTRGDSTGLRVGRIGRRPAQLPSGRHRRLGGDPHGNSRERRRRDRSAFRPRGFPAQQRFGRPPVGSVVAQHQRSAAIYVTADGPRAYVRVGSPITGSKLSDNEPVQPLGKLVGLDLTAQRRLALEIKLEGPEWNNWALEGTPLVDERPTVRGPAVPGLRACGSLCGLLRRPAGAVDLAAVLVRSRNVRIASVRNHAHAIDVGRGHFVLQHQSRSRGGGRGDLRRNPVAYHVSPDHTPRQ